MIVIYFKGSLLFVLSKLHHLNEEERAGCFALIVFLLSCDS